jgi:GT2 family glycosyltransferase
MRVLAHIHTHNDADVIAQVLDAVQRQTRQAEDTHVVDNVSTDGTLDRVRHDGVTVIRHPDYRGVSGALRTDFTYALEHGFDWVWVLDADSVPEPDALEHLLAFFERLSPQDQEQVCFLACQAVDPNGEIKDRPVIFTEMRIQIATPDAEGGYSRCDSTLWTGSLYRMAAVEKIGLPSADYVLDMGEIEYGYRAWRLGFTSYLVHSSILHMDVGRDPGVAPKTRRFGPLKLRLYETSPIRCYYRARNIIYFAMYQCRPRRLRWVVRSIMRSFAFTTTFAVRPVSNSRQLGACLRGIWDGLTMHMERRY